jgi:hypothetical protein
VGSRGGLGIPIIVILITISFQLRSAARERTAASKRQTEEAQATFRMKCAEFILGSRSPAVASRRAEILEAAYGEWLPKGFFTGHDLKRLPGHMHEIKLELFKAIAANPGRRGDIVTAWSTFFPDEARMIDWSALDAQTRHSAEHRPTPP